MTTQPLTPSEKARLRELANAIRFGKHPDKDGIGTFYDIRAAMVDDEGNIVKSVNGSSLCKGTNLYVMPCEPKMLGEGITALLDEIEALRVDPKLHEGAPPHPWDTEWFIAITIYGDRVVLKELPDEYTYDYTTADGTYMLKSNVAKWMQFPDSQFVDYTARQKETP